MTYFDRGFGDTNGPFGPFSDEGPGCEIVGEPDQLCFDLQNNGDWTQPFVLQDYNAATGTRVPHDLTGTKLRMQLKAVPAPPAQFSPSEAVALDASTTNGMFTIASDPTTGAFVLHVPASDMFMIPQGVYAGDMLIFNMAGAVTPAFAVRVNVHDGITPPTKP